MRRRGSFVDVGQIEERLDVPPRRFHARRQERVIAIGVHRLLEVRVARVLRADLRLVHAQVGRLERALHEVDDRRVHAQPAEVAAAVERELAAEAVLLGPERGPGRRHLGIAAPELGGAASRRPVALGIGVELLRRRERVLEIGRRGIDLVGVDETVEQDPAVFPPRRDLVVASEPPTHSPPPVRRALPATSRAHPVRRRITLDLMADKSPKKSNSKKPGKTLEGEARRQAGQARRQASRYRRLSSFPELPKDTVVAPERVYRPRGCRTRQRLSVVAVPRVRLRAVRERIHRAALVLVGERRGRYDAADDHVRRAARSHARRSRPAGGGDRIVGARP